MDNKKAYYAIIPANVRYDADLTPSAKLLYGEITALCNEKGYCWAGNEYFSKLYEVNKSTISRWVNQLVKKGYLTSDLIYKGGSKEIEGRYLRISTPTQNEVYPIRKNEYTPTQNEVYPIRKNEIDNNTINNTSNNTLDIKNIVPNGTSSSSNKYNIFFETYNDQKIITHQKLTKVMKQAIDRALKKNSQEDILTAIERYGQAYNSDYKFAKFKMTLDKLLTQSNGYQDWLDEGQKWINYSDFKDKGATYAKTTKQCSKDDKGIDIAEQAGILSF